MSESAPTRSLARDSAAMSEELEAVQALYANYEDKAVMLSASSIAVLFYALEAIKPLYRWKNGATDEITSGDADEIQRIVDLAFFEVMGELEPVAREIGEIAIYTSATLPSKWLPCTGLAISRTTYAALFAVIGTTFGGGDGSTTFNIPTLSNRFPKMYSPSNPTGENAIGGTGGLNTVTLDISEIPAHTHAQRVQPNSGASTNRIQAQTASGATQDSALPTGSAGGGGSHENRPPFLSLEFMIYTGVT